MFLNRIGTLLKVLLLMGLLSFLAIEKMLAQSMNNAQVLGTSGSIQLSSHLVTDCSDFHQISSPANAKDLLIQPLINDNINTSMPLLNQTEVAKRMKRKCKSN